MNSPTMKDVLESLQYLTPEERAEMDELLAGVPEPITIVWEVIRPDLSVETYLMQTPDGPVEIPADHPLLAGRTPATPEVNGGYRPGERP